MRDNGWTLSVEEVCGRNQIASLKEWTTQAKKEKLIASALTYTTTHENLPALWRIDFVAVELDDKGKTRRIELIENAIEQVSRFNC